MVHIFHRFTGSGGKSNHNRLVYEETADTFFCLIMHILYKKYAIPVIELPVNRNRFRKQDHGNG